MSFGERADHEGVQSAELGSHETILDFSPTSDREAATPVGGWLLYFCVALTVFSPLSFLRAAEDSHTVLFRCFYGAIGAVQFMTGLALWSRSRIVIPMLWVSLATRSVYTVFQVWIALRLAGRITPNSALSAEKEFTNAAINIAGLVINFFYFRWSSRVKRTYGTNL